MTTGTGTRRGTILFAHGSRDPLWRGPIEAVARRAREIDPHARVTCAYLELTEPDLPTVAADMVGAGFTTLTIVPLFLGIGRHAREDLPLLVAQLRATHPEVTIELRPAVGEDPHLVDLLARMAIL
jgi:sirohydrochlorin cobaltochelatase